MVINYSSRVAIISGGYLLNASGSEKGAQALAEALVPKVKEVHVFTFHVKNHPIEHNGVIIHPVLNRLFAKKMRFLYEYVNSFSTIYKLILLAKKHKIQILNVHDNQTLAVCVGLVGKILRIPVILSWIRTGDIGFRGINGKPSFKFKMRRLKAGLAIRLADLILTKGPCPSDYLKYYKTDINKFIQTPNPIQLPKNEENPFSASILESYNLKRCFCVSTLASRLDETKSIDVILKTAALLKAKKITDVRFLIVGGRNPRTVDFWRRKSKEFQVEDYTIFIGFQENVYPFLTESDVYIFATASEVCCSRGLLEAMISELPAVCRKTRSMAHWFKHLEDIYFVDAATPEEFAKAILYLKKNESTRNKIGSKARQKVLKEWDVEKFVDEFVDISRNLIIKRNSNRVGKQS